MNHVMTEIPLAHLGVLRASASVNRGLRLLRMFRPDRFAPSPQLEKVSTQSCTRAIHEIMLHERRELP